MYKRDYIVCINLNSFKDYTSIQIFVTFLYKIGNISVLIFVKPFHFRSCLPQEHNDHLPTFQLRCRHERELHSRQFLPHSRNPRQ